MKFTRERAEELLPQRNGTFKPSIQGKQKYQRIAICKRHTLMFRWEHRLFIGSMIEDNIIDYREIHPDTIPDTIVRNGEVIEVSFGNSYKIETLMPISELNMAHEKGGEK